MEVGIGSVDSGLWEECSSGRPDIVIGIVIRLRSEQPGVPFPFPMGTGDMFGLQNVHNGTETRQLSV